MSTEKYLRPQAVQTVAIVGTGAVGASWAALLLAHDIAVVAFDPLPDAEPRTQEFIRNAWHALRDLNIARRERPRLDQLVFVGSAGKAAEMADVIQENVPEKSHIKAEVLAEIDSAAASHKIILSSTGGILPTQMQRACRHPERLVVVHPFNPAHLMPLVEVVGGTLTSSAVVDWAMEFARRLGKQPIKLNIETNGHMTNRLQFALVREAVRCLVDGVASAKDIDAAVRYGLGPRWALMGSLLTLHLAGGAGGMRGILEHAGDAIEQWWTPSAPVQLTPEVRARLIEAGEEVSDGLPIGEWVRWRDALLINVLKLQRAAELGGPAAAHSLNEELKS